MPVTVTRKVFSVVPTCPAALPVAEAPKGSGVVCRVEDSVILAGSDPRTLAVWCLAGYCGCPTWQTAKEAAWADRAE